MARKRRSIKLDTPTARAELKPRKQLYCQLLAPGCYVGYRRNPGAAGSWSAKWAREDARGKYTIERIALADDREPNNDKTVLDYWKARDKALEHIRLRQGGGSVTGKLVTIEQAIQRYEDGLIARGADKRNASVVRYHVKGTPLYTRLVSSVSKQEFLDWRNALIISGMNPRTVDRINKAFKACLTLAASCDPRIRNRLAWVEGLASLTGDDDDTDGGARDVIQSPATLTAIVEACYQYSDEYGLVIDALNETGTRESQLYRCEVRDLLDRDLNAPILLMPSSSKRSQAQDHAQASADLAALGSRAAPSRSRPWFAGQAGKAGQAQRQKIS